MKRTNRVVVSIWVLLGVFVLTLFDWQFGGLRFISPHMGWLLSFATWLPVVSVGLLGFLPRSRARVWAFACLIPTALLCLVVGPLFILLQSMTAVERESAIRLGGSEIVTYYSDAGGWDSGEVTVQQEIKLLPGIFWVKPISSSSARHPADISVLNRHHVRCSYAADTTAWLGPNPKPQQEDVWVF